MKNENKVLACVDQSHFADYVADYAAWAARRMDGASGAYCRQNPLCTQRLLPGRIGVSGDSCEY